MEIVILIAVMVVVGVIVGLLSGAIWKEERPLGAQGDTVVAIITCILVGLLDWYIIPAMGFSDTLKYIGVVFEPPLAALIVLWLIRRSRQQ